MLLFPLPEMVYPSPVFVGKTPISFSASQESLLSFPGSSGESAFELSYSSLVI